MKPIKARECFQFVQKNSQFFPMSLEYFNKDPGYLDDNYIEWFQIYITNKTNIAPAALVAFKVADDFWIEESLHLSVLEIAKPIQRIGYGRQIMKHLINTAIDNKYHYMTLQLRTPELKSFYTQFGFANTDIEGTRVMVLDL